MNPPYPSEITAFETPLSLGISNDRGGAVGGPWGWGGGGYGYFLEPHIPRCDNGVIVLPNSLPVSPG